MSISITVDTGTGNMTVAPSAAYFAPLDTVMWQLQNGTSLTIAFKDQSPFSVHQLRGGASLEASILTDAKGVYHYSVSALVDGKIYTIPGCPEIIVQ